MPYLGIRRQNQTGEFTTNDYRKLAFLLQSVGPMRTAILLALSLAILVYSGEPERLPAVTPRTWAVLGLSGLATSVTLIIAGALLAASAR